MAAPLGFKTFTVGEVLSAADVNGYLMQGVLVFATTAARDAAITSPQEGQFAFTKDTNSLFYYDGAAWVASGATGDIEGVTAGVGISGGGTSGTVTVTNSMATAIDAKGDLIVGTGADTFSRLAVGTNTYTLVADSSEATGLKWAAPAGGSITLLSTTSLTGAVVTLSSISQSYQHLYLVIDKVTNLTSNGQTLIKPNASANVQMSGQRNNAGNAAVDIQTNTAVNCGWNTNRTNADNTAGLFIYDYTTTTRHKRLSYINGGVDGVGGNSAAHQQGVIMADAAISSIGIENNGGDFNGGTAYLYGVK